MLVCCILRALNHQVIMNVTQMKMNIVAQPVLIHSVFTAVKNVIELTECEALL